MAEILTNNAMFSSFMIVLIVFALGDIVGKITKGKLSGMMVVMLLFLVGFLTKLFPADIIDQGGLTALSKLAIAMVLFNMGTTLNVKQLIEEWRTVLMAALCMLASCLVMLLASPIIGFDTVLVGMPVINGAAMATSLMASAAAEKGLATAAALCAVIYSVQKFVGAPIASAMGIRYGKKLLKAYRENPTQFQKQETGKGASAKVFFADKHKEWYSANVMMALVAAGSWVAHILGDLTPINYSIWALLLGVVCGCFRTRSDETAAEIELLRPHDDCCLRFHHPVPGKSFLKRSRHHGIPDNRSVRRSADRCCTGWLGSSDLETRGRQRPGSRHRCRAVPRIPEQRGHLPRGRRCSRRDTGGESVYRRYAECAVCRGRNYGYHRSFDDAGWICH